MSISSLREKTPTLVFDTGFFRRCITQGINFRCSNEEKCQITPFTRNSCQYCRLKRCFQVGMSREASRLGRRPKKIMKSGVLTSKDFQRQISEHLDTKSSSSSSPDSTQNNMLWDYPSLARATLSDMMGCTPEMMHKLSSMMSAGGMPTGGIHPPFDMNGMTGGGVSPLDMSGCRMGYPDPSLVVDVSDCKADAGDVTHSELNKWREKQFQVMSRYMHSNKDSSIDEGSDTCEIPTIIRTDDLGSKGSSPTYSTMLSPFSTASMTSSNSGQSHSQQTILSLSDVQKAKLELFMTYTQAPRSEVTESLIDEVHSSIIDSHLTHCYHLRPRINAAVAEIRAREQMGEDVRPPTGFWAHWMSELLPTIERVVRFLKDIPGFRELHLNDQILLIKKGAFSIVLCQAMPMVDHVNLCMLDPRLKYKNSRSDFENMPSQFQRLFDDHFVLAKQFKDIDITDNETALLNAVISVNSGIDGLEHAVAVGKLECLFVQTFHKYVTSNNPEQPDRFEKLIRLIPMVENISLTHSHSLNNMKGKHSADSSSGTAQFPDLHKEIWQ